MTDASFVRNVAIVAHIDHGKTTLLNTMLEQSNLFRENQEVPKMDSFDQESERGITIFAKHTTIPFEDYSLHLIDTPGHADFSGEVERILGMVSSVLLIVDAQDGPMPQTRFVLSKSLKMGLKPIVVLNKIDRPHADPDRVLNEVFDLFVELGASDEQLDFRYIYASALEGFACKEISEEKKNLRPLFQLIVDAVPPPQADAEKPFILQVSTLFYDDFLGRQVCGRIIKGKVKKNDELLLFHKGSSVKGKVTKVEEHKGVERVAVEKAEAGSIVILSGFEKATIGDTLCSWQHPEELPPIAMEEPTVSIDLLVNDGPFVGKSGKHVTMNKIRERLLREQKSNIAYKIEEDPKDQTKIKVSGRGELHLAVLLETLRREDYEFCVSKPEVIYQEEQGVKKEPYSKVYIEVPDEYSGKVIEHLSKNKGEMQHLEVDEQGITHMEFLIPTRGIMGYRQYFLTVTRGLGILTSSFAHYGPFKGELPKRTNGVLVALSSGKVTAYASFQIEDRGRLFTVPTEEIYEGMVVGEHNRENDLIVNLTKEKHLTNVRAAGSDENIILKPPHRFTLEDAITYIEKDELIEVTPNAIRLRKRFLKETDRTRMARKKSLSSK